MRSPRHIKRLIVAAFLVSALFGVWTIASSSADLQSQIQASRSAAASLQDQINAQTSQIEQTANGVANAQQRLSTVQAQLDEHVAQLRLVQTRALTAKWHLVTLEKRLQVASTDLASNLRDAYESGAPNLVDVILNAHGFSNLLDQVNYIKDAQTEDQQIVAFTKAARTKVQKEALALGTLEQKDRTLTNQIVDQRNQVAAIETALVNQQSSEENQRAHTRSKLANANATAASLQTKLNQEEAAQAAAAAAAARQAAAARAAAQATPEQVNQQVGGVAIDTGGMVQPPPGAPAAVREMIAAGNAIATLPYIWGGGHGSFISPGYDCSGSVSYVLNAAGLLSSPETSGEFESYGDPGAGQYVTIYANEGHVWMTIAGWRFDTVALAEDGTRWSQGGGEFGGFVERHPPGL
jgi:peptidoglycan hydrolase CwlO-like protein